MGFITGSNIRVLLSASALGLFASLTVAHASTFKVLYSFSGGSNGGYPISLTKDSNGNLYGPDEQPTGYGSVFKLAPNGNFDIYYLLKGGEGPSGVVVEPKGSIWVTVGGGGIGGGVIFEIRPTGREVLKHTFMGSPTDGCAPEPALIKNHRDGKFYGTTFGCGKYDYGTVFTLALDGSESLFYSFKGGRDGLYPSAGLIIDAQGNLYGTTDYGGKIAACSNGFGGCGTVFKLAPNGTKTVLYKFKGPPGDGYLPEGNVITDASGDIYGTTIYGGRAGCMGDEGCGAVFKLAPDGTETVLHFFAGEGSDGGNPPSGLIEDSGGNLYGTTLYGGGRYPCNGADGCGTVFEIAPDGTETILHKFKESTDGANPSGGLVADAAGNLYGAAQNGGANGYGTVFEITP